MFEQSYHKEKSMKMFINLVAAFCVTSVIMLSSVQV